MATKKFTAREMDQLRESPYVVDVTQSIVHFSAQFKALFYEGLQAGKAPVEVVIEHGIDPEILGVNRVNGLKCPIRKENPYRRMAKALKTSYVAPNLLNREFETHGPRAVLLTDITYISNGKAPRCYLSAMIDACTKELLAWVLSESLEVDFVLETVNQLMERHGPSLQAQVLIHSDQGAHYTSVKFVQLVKDSQLRQSMSRRANCWDNAPQESFFGHMKDEIDLSGCTCFEHIHQAIRAWADYYNNERYQWDLARLAPAEYYRYLMTGEYPLSVPPPKTDR